MSSTQSGVAVSDVYAAVANRRTQFDNLLWQVPVLTFTAQAFLFTIALAGDTSRTARIITSLLALLMSLLAWHLMARHRKAEVADGNWLAAVEAATAASPTGAGLPSTATNVQWPMHGTGWRDYRNTADPDVGPVSTKIALLGGFTVWSKGLLIFGLAAIVVLGLSLWRPEVLSSEPADSPTIVIKVPGPSHCRGLNGSLDQGRNDGRRCRNG
ncbi:hypothetical protein F0U44_02815 [Nocardioides humilatus]|uniref:Uncharacterized protein n=1 Tax=Nocardioides humilatus TaxID=2607660 RepID=A0A5B1LKL6_9ACTN|nr:hypothetical protein [Nocardioides humilatus]KAA1421261.1 hypothetical protein F0U44_02815 [Nocardioides humilatus]